MLASYEISKGIRHWNCGKGSVITLAMMCGPLGAAPGCARMPNKPIAKTLSFLVFLNGFRVEFSGVSVIYLFSFYKKYHNGKDFIVERYSQKTL